MHEILILITLNGEPSGTIEKTFEGTREEAEAEIAATCQRNRENNPQHNLSFDITLNGEPYGPVP